MNKKRTNTQPYEGYRISRREIMINNFLGGISWAVGTSVGLTVVVTLIGFLFKNIGLVPIIGSFITQITDFVVANSRQL